MFTRDAGDLAGTEAALSIIVATPTDPLPIPNIRKIDLAQKMIVSYKCMWNLLDLTSLWKKTVLNKLEKDALVTEETFSSDMDVSLSDLSETDPAYLFSMIDYLWKATWYHEKFVGGFGTRCSTAGHNDVQEPTWY